MFAYYTQVIMDKNYHILSTVLWMSGKSTRLWSYCGRFVHNIYQSAVLTRSDFYRASAYNARSARYCYGKDLSVCLSVLSNAYIYIYIYIVCVCMLKQMNTLLLCWTVW